MNRRDAAAEEGVRFFGRVTASISHELSNVLATIYENAGLVEDLLSAAERGRPLDGSRLRELALRVKTQVMRGRDIVGNMNRFAHSVDETWDSLDLRQLLTLTVSLARRAVSMNGFEVKVEEAGNPVQIRTDPFLLQNLVWLCLDFIMGAGGPSKSIRVVPEEREGKAYIRFLGVSVRECGIAFPTRSQEVLGKAVGALLSINEESGEMTLSIRRDLEKAI